VSLEQVMMHHLRLHCVLRHNTSFATLSSRQVLYLFVIVSLNSISKPTIVAHPMGRWGALLYLDLTKIQVLSRDFQ